MTLKLVANGKLTLIAKIMVAHNFFDTNPYNFSGTIINFIRDERITEGPNSNMPNSMKVEKPKGRIHKSYDTLGFVEPFIIPEKIPQIFRVLKGRILNSKKHDAMISWLPNVRFSACSHQSLCVLRNALEMNLRNNNLYYDLSSALHPVQNYKKTPRDIL